MKRFILTVSFFFVMITLSGDFIVQKTATIDSLTLSKIREACHPQFFPNSLYGDPLVETFFLKLYTKNN